MDTLEQILRDTIETDNFDGRGAWTITNTSAVVHIKARSSTSYDTSAAAFEAARELVAVLTSGTGYELVNRADFGVGRESLGAADDGWHATLDACLGRLEQDTYPITLD